MKCNQLDLQWQHYSQHHFHQMYKRDCRLSQQLYKIFHWLEKVHTVCWHFALIAEYFVNFFFFLLTIPQGKFILKHIQARKERLRVGTASARRWKWCSRSPREKTTSTQESFQHSTQCLYFCPQRESDQDPLAPKRKSFQMSYCCPDAKQASSWAMCGCTGGGVPLSDSSSWIKCGTNTVVATLEVP